MAKNPSPDPRLHLDDGSTPDPQDGPAAIVHVQQTWALYLGTRDMLLILKALGGRLNSEADEEAAEALGDRLTLLREKSVKEVNHGVMRAAESVREAAAAKS